MEKLLVLLCGNFNNILEAMTDTQNQYRKNLLLLDCSKLPFY